MARSIILACKLNELSDFTFIRQQNDVDGSFLINCILGQNFLNPNSATILVCMHHTNEHYVDAGKRLGFNLNDARSKGRLVIIDFMKDLTTKLFNLNSFSIQSDNIVNDLLANIVNKVETLLKDRSTVTVILDDISTLSYLKANDNLIMAMCRRFKKLSEILTPKLRFVIKLHTCNLYETLASNVSDLADLEIEVNILPSGHSKEVDGKLVIKTHHGIEEKTILYKINERNIVVMQPGEPGLNL